jgi:hypothetical protein
VTDLAQAARAAAVDPSVVFVYQGTPQQGAEWFAGLPESMRAIADADKVLYRAFDVERGGLGAMFGPGAIACGLRASRKGHRIGRKVGDPWTLPLAVAVRGGAVVWEHRGRHAGDHPDAATLLAQA